MFDMNAVRTCHVNLCRRCDCLVEKLQQIHGVARYLLELFDQAIATTAEIDVAGAHRVHVEHIYPQNPKTEDKWEQHAAYVQRLGNLTLLDKRLNVQIKNGRFSA